MLAASVIISDISSSCMVILWTNITQPWTQCGVIGHQWFLEGKYQSEC